MRTVFHVLRASAAGYLWFERRRGAFKYVMQETIRRQTILDKTPGATVDFISWGFQFPSAFGKREIVPFFTSQWPSWCLFSKLCKLVPLYIARRFILQVPFSHTLHTDFSAWHSFKSLRMGKFFERKRRKKKTNLHSLKENFKINKTARIAG